MKLKIVAILAGLFLVGTLFMPGGSSINVKNIYEEAEKSLQEKKYQEAITKYELAMEEGKKWGADTKVIDEDFDSLAKFKIAVAYSELGKQMDDPTMYEKSLEYIPDLYEKATVAKQREGLIFLWGDNYYRLERYEEAEPKFRELLNDYPDSRFGENAYYSLGNLYYELKQYELSRESFKMVIDKFPNSDFIGSSQFFIAKCFFDEANYDQSHLEFEKVQTEDQVLSAQARYYDGLSLFRMGRNQEALTAYQKFIADFPNSVFITAAYFDMGTIHGKLKEYDEATRNYELAIQHAKDDITRAQIQFYIGGNYFSAEDYQAAIDAYRRLMQDYPESVDIPQARFMIAESNWHLKAYEDAIAGYTEILEKDSESENVPYSMYQIGECHYQLGDKEMALEWYNKMLEAHPDSPTVKDATYSKIWSLNDLGRYEEADSVGRDYINKYKEDKVYDIAAAETQTLLGDIKFDADDYISAADEYLRVISDYLDLPKFDLFKCKSLLQAGLAYYKEAEAQDWDMDLLSKAADAFSKLLDQYETNFDKEKREFEFRTDYVTRGIINLGLSYSNMKEFDKARAALDMMPRTSSEYGTAMFLKGQTYVDEGKVDDAVAIYRQMVEDESLSATSRSLAAMNMAERLRDAERHAEAAVEYQRVVEQYPDSERVSEASYLVGLSYYDIEPKTTENLTKAIEAFKRTLDNYTGSRGALLAHLNMAFAYEAMDAYDMVVKVADEIENQYADSDLEDAPDMIDRSRRLKVDAMMKLEEGVSTDVLIAELRKVVANPVGDEPGRAAAQLRIGTLLYNEERFGEAVVEYDSLLEKFPGQYSGSAYYQISTAAYRMEDYQKSITSAQKGLMESDLTQFLKVAMNYTLGLAYDKIGNANDSIAALKQTGQLGAEPEEDRTKDTVFAARRELARVYRSAGFYKEAADEYRFVAENSPDAEDKTDNYFWLAKLYEENLQDYDNAVKHYAKVLELGTSSDVMTAQALWFTGVIYADQLKDDEKALSSFQDLVSRYSELEDSNAQLMITGANLRVPDLLVKLGKFDDAIARAREVRDGALAGDDREEKINAQYSLAYLLGEQAEQAGDMELSGQAAEEYARVYGIAQPLSEVSDESKTRVAASLYNAGYLYYGLAQYEDYGKAVENFEFFTKHFPKSENYSAALEYLGFASFEMARLKADLDGFARAAEYFLRFAREMPNHNDAAVAQYQAGDAYFAVGGGHSGNAEEATDPGVTAREISLATEAYKKSISAYRGLVDKYPNTEYAPEALYAMAASHGYVAEASTDDSAKQQELDKMSAVYKELAEKYPQSEHAASAFLSVGNDYYNQAAAPDLSAEEKTNLYKLSLENYRRALQVPGIESRTRMQVDAFMRETEELLAIDTYSLGASLVPFGAGLETNKANAPKAIPYFKEVIDTLPNTDHADLSYVQLGLCYEYLEQWEDAEGAYGNLIQKYTDADGNPIAPFSDNVVQAVQFAKDRKAKLMAYRISIRTQQQSGG
jgi:tetratricopeptide (TPR) repeat protein